MGLGFASSRRPWGRYWIGTPRGLEELSRERLDLSNLSLVPFMYYALRVICPQSSFPETGISYAFSISVPYAVLVGLYVS